MTNTISSKYKLEAPIIFSGEMVRALIENRKTQTRRIVKDTDTPPTIPARYDIETLWVRETWRGVHSGTHECWHYRAADRRKRPIDPRPWKSPIFMPRCASRIDLRVESVTSQYLQDITMDDAIAEGIELAWEGTGFNSHQEFLKAHLANPRIRLQWKKYGKHHSGIFHRTYAPIASYRSLWESIHGHGSWDENPQVWVIKFQSILKHDER